MVFYNFKLSKIIQTGTYLFLLMCMYKYNIIRIINFIFILISEVRKNTDTPVIYYVVGNKTDLLDTRVITYEEAKEFADSVNAHYWETSVYSNTGEI